MARPTRPRGSGYGSWQNESPFLYPQTPPVNDVPPPKYPWEDETTTPTTPTVSGTPTTPPKGAWKKGPTPVATTTLPTSNFADISPVFTPPPPAGEDTTPTDTGGGTGGTGGTGGFDAGGLLFGDWQGNAGGSFDPQALLDMIQGLPAAQQNVELYAPLVKELQNLIATKGQSGVVPVEQQFGAVRQDLEQTSQENFRRTMGDLARTGTLESGGLREARIRENIALNRGLTTARVAIETENSRQAAEKYSQALTQIQQLQEQAASGELNWFQAIVQMQALGAENERAWAQMGLSERLGVMGFDVERYKTDQATQLSRERLALERELGFADINLRQLIEQNNWNLEQTKLQLQERLAQGGWAQQDADRALNRWAELLRAEVQNKRTDVDMINAMGKLTRDQWEREIAQADLELKRYLGTQEYELRKTELGQDWRKFLEQQATTRWLASNQWEVDKYIARIGADAQKKGWFESLLDFAGDVVPALI